MWITKKPWCDYMAMKLDHKDPFNQPHQGYLLRRVYYSEDFITNWMFPRLRYFSQCLIDRIKPPKTLYTEINLAKFPKVRIETIVEGGNEKHPIVI